MASANVTRTVGIGAWANANVPARQSPMASVAQAFRPAIAGLKPCATKTRFRCRQSSSATASNALDHDIQDRDEREVQECRCDHAAGDGGADRMARLAPGAAGDDERHDTEDERQRRHE